MTKPPDAHDAARMNPCRTRTDHAEDLATSEEAVTVPRVDQATKIPLEWDPALDAYATPDADVEPTGPLGVSVLWRPGLDVTIDRADGVVLAAVVAPDAQLGEGIDATIDDESALSISPSAGIGLALAAACWDHVGSEHLNPSTQAAACVEAMHYSLDGLNHRAKAELLLAHPWQVEMVRSMADTGFDHVATGLDEVSARLLTRMARGVRDDADLGDLAQGRDARRPSRVGKGHHEAVMLHWPDPITVSVGTKGSVRVGGHTYRYEPVDADALLVIVEKQWAAYLRINEVDSAGIASTLLLDSGGDEMTTNVRLDTDVVIHAVHRRFAPSRVELREQQDAAWLEMLRAADLNRSGSVEHTGELGRAYLALGEESRAIAALALAGRREERWAAAASAVSGAPAPTPRLEPWDQLMWPRAGSPPP